MAMRKLAGLSRFQGADELSQQVFKIPEWKK